MSEAVIKAVRKARAEHKKTYCGRLDELSKVGRKWARRLTIADNKHREAIEAVFQLAFDMATELDKRKDGQ